MVTSEPAAAATWANSIETYPPPTNTTRGGRVSRSRNWSRRVRRCSPGIPSVAGLIPAAMTTCRASITVPSTSMDVRPVKRECPWKVAMPAWWKLFSRLAGVGSVNVRLKRINSLQSIRIPRPSTPFPSSRRAAFTTSAAPTRTFFGSQPRSAQVPPNGRSSTTATVQPAARHLQATVDAAEPVPIQTRSYCCAMFLLFRDAPTYSLSREMTPFCNRDHLRPTERPRGS